MANRKFGPLNRLRERYEMYRDGEIAVQNAVEDVIGVGMQSCLIRGSVVGGLAGAAIASVGPESVKAKVRIAGIAGAACVAGAYVSDKLADRARTRKQTNRMFYVSEILSFAGGVGLGALAGSAAVNKLTGKPALPAFNGDPDTDPIVLAAQRL
jgi:hypothetical protein